MCAERRRSAHELAARELLVGRSVNTAESALDDGRARASMRTLPVKRHSLVASNSMLVATRSSADDAQSRLA